MVIIYSGIGLTIYNNDVMIICRVKAEVKWCIFKLQLFDANFFKQNNNKQTKQNNNK